jgi:geranylgeranyl pyrophosphate synthase
VTEPTNTATLAPSSAPRELAKFLDDARLAVDAELERRLAIPTDDPGRLAEAMHYAATGPGKRLRPALLLAAAEACGGSREGALPAAAAIEMLHAYTLVHDDLPAMDDDDERRGRPTVHIAFGEAIAILAGDGLLTAAFGTLASLGARAGDAVAVLARRSGVAELLGGQAIDLTTPREQLTTLAAIEKLHAAKTGALFAAAAELGAISAGADAPTRARLATFGMAIGIAFQHADDRDDAELVEHAAAAARRMRELCDEAITAVVPLNSVILVGFARWIASRA